MSTSFRLLLIFLLSISGVLLFKPPPYDILLAVTMAYWFVVRGFGIDSRIMTPVLFLSIYVGFYWLSITQCNDVRGSLWYACLTTFCAALWLFFTNVLNRYGLPAFHAIMKGYAVTSVVGVVFGFVVYVTDFPGRERFLYNYRPKGLYVDANVFAPSLVVVLLYAFCRLIIRPRFNRSFAAWSATAFVASAGLFISFSRGAWINAGLAILMFLFLLAISTESAGSLFKRFALLSIGVIACASILYVALGDRDDFADIARNRSHLQGYDQERFASHDNAWQVALENPWLGIGPAQYIRTFHIATHSLPLHILAENGFPALAALFGFLLVTIFRSANQIRRCPTAEGRTYFCAITSLLIAQMVNSSVIDTLHWRHLWLLCAFAWMPVRERAADTLHQRLGALLALAHLENTMRPALVETNELRS
jgi:O-antigen ligase